MISVCPICKEGYHFVAIKECRRCKVPLIDPHDPKAAETWEQQISQEIYELEVEMGLRPKAESSTRGSLRPIWIGAASFMMIAAFVAFLVF